MIITESEKADIKRALVRALSAEKEIRRIVVFGSFVHSNSPNDVDVAVFQDSDEKYLPLALKYRKDVRSVPCRIPIDVIPLRPMVQDDPFLDEVQQGETIYERQRP